MSYALQIFWTVSERVAYKLIVGCGVSRGDPSTGDRRAARRPRGQDTLLLRPDQGERPPTPPSPAPSPSPPMPHLHAVTVTVTSPPSPRYPHLYPHLYSHLYPHLYARLAVAPALDPAASPASRSNARRCTDPTPCLARPARGASCAPHTPPQKSTIALAGSRLMAAVVVHVAHSTAHSGQLCPT